MFLGSSTLFAVSQYIEANTWNSGAGNFNFMAHNLGPDKRKVVAVGIHSNDQGSGTDILITAASIAGKPATVIGPTIGAEVGRNGTAIIYTEFEGGNTTGNIMFSISGQANRTKIGIIAMTDYASSIPYSSAINNGAAPSILLPINVPADGVVIGMAGLEGAGTVTWANNLTNVLQETFDTSYSCALAIGNRQPAATAKNFNATTSGTASFFGTIASWR